MLEERFGSVRGSTMDLFVAITISRSESLRPVELVYMYGEAKIL